MNPFVIFGVSSLVTMAALTLFQCVNAIFEDQLIACNFENECVTINVDDYLDKDKADKLWSQYENDIDTFSIEDLTQ